MADPVSLIAGVISFTALAYDVSLSVQRFCEAYREAHTDLHRVTNQLNTLAHTLEDFKWHLESGPCLEDDWKLKAHGLLELLEPTLFEFQTLLERRQVQEKLSKKASWNKVRGKSARVRIRGRLKALESDVESLKSDLGTQSHISPRSCQRQSIPSFDDASADAGSLHERHSHNKVEKIGVPAQLGHGTDGLESFDIKLSPPLHEPLKTSLAETSATIEMTSVAEVSQSEVFCLLAGKVSLVGQIPLLSALCGRRESSSRSCGIMDRVTSLPLNTFIVERNQVWAISLSLASVTVAISALAILAFRADPSRRRTMLSALCFTTIIGCVVWSREGGGAADFALVLVPFALSVGASLSIGWERMRNSLGNC